MTIVSDVNNNDEELGCFVYEAGYYFSKEEIFINGIEGEETPWFEEFCNSLTENKYNYLYLEWQKETAEVGLSESMKSLMKNALTEVKVKYSDAPVVMY